MGPGWHQATWGSDGESWGRAGAALTCTCPGGLGVPRGWAQRCPMWNAQRRPGLLGVSLPEPLGSPLLPNHHVSFVVFSAKCCFECFLEK